MSKVRNDVIGKHTLNVLPKLLDSLLSNHHLQSIERYWFEFGALSSINPIHDHNVLDYSLFGCLVNYK